MVDLLFENLKNLVPIEYQKNLTEDIRRHQLTGSKLVVIDDDPTGSQNIKDIPVLTEWGVETLVEEMRGSSSAFFILTNSRGYLEPEAKAINEQIGANLRQAAAITGRKLSIVSRGDSTLRGHFPAEVDALANGFGESFDAIFIIPALFEAGRYTYQDTHYVLIGEHLVPVGETEYAKDKTFGYSSSNLHEWIQEKMGSTAQSNRYLSISIEDLRMGGPDLVKEKLATIGKGEYCVVNALHRKDLDVFALAAQFMETSGKRYAYRTAPSFIPSYLGLEPYPLMNSISVTDDEKKVGGLTIVGSYVKNTTRQVEEVISHGGSVNIEIDVAGLLGEDYIRHALIQAIADKVNNALLAGDDVMLFTSRKLRAADDAEKSLLIGQLVSKSLIQILDLITTRPRYIIAKGGITSSDVATKGLNVKRGVVVGQISRGISVWVLGAESRFPGINYIVFPGNVGDSDTLALLIEKLKG